MTETTSADTGYLTHLGLSHNPFPVVPDDTCIFLSNRIEQIVVEIVHGIKTRKGFMMLTGDVGLGKTTISRRIISILEEKGIETALVLHTSLQDAELLREINRDFGIDSPLNHADGLSLGEQLRQLNRFLLNQYQQNKNCAIIIDDAQNLNRRSLELVRMISNLEGHRQKLVQILLIGQPELAQLLNTHELRQLRSRVVIAAQALPLSRQELKAYIHFKLNSAGNHGQTSVTGWALDRIYRFTRGNFRMVNLLMDRCLYVTCLNNSRQIDGGTVKLAYQDLFPKPRRFKYRWLAATAITLSLLAAVSMGFFSRPKTHDDLLSLKTADELSLKTADELPSPPPEDFSSKLSPAVKNSPPETSSSDAMAAFFSSLGAADDYAGRFHQAIEHGELERFTHDLYQTTGYHLIGLTRLNPDIRRNYGILTLNDGLDDTPRHYILWRPPIQIKKFYYYYKGGEINQLQSLLAKANLYQNRLDDIVGPGLMRAVVNFQKLIGLPVTGYPDPQTLFWLCHFKENAPIG